MKKWILLTGMVFAGLFTTQAQSRKNDIPASQLPASVKTVLETYIKILGSSPDIESCAKAFTAIAGGSLVNEDAENISLRDDTKRYALKKDFENVKFYAQPLVITRVNLGYSNGSGYGASAIKGKVYKIWIGKKDGTAGLPAPISILVPEDHASIKDPKVVGIGSL